MLYMEKSNNFSYWRRPWQKWVVFIAGILQVISLSLNIQEYKDIAKAGIFSPSAWESYAVQQGFRCALNGLTAAIFLGIFLIGIFARSPKMARMTEGVLLLVLALVWGGVGFSLQIISQSGIKIIWSLLWLLIFGGSVYAFWKSRNS